MRTLVAALLLLNIFHLLLAVGFATSTGFSNVPVYDFAVPHLGCLGVATVLLGYSLAKQPSSRVLELIIAAVLAMTLLTAIYAGYQWPGGNDGPGIAWVFIVGGFSLVNAGASVVLGMAALKHR
jgi:hypothetical protein